MDQGEVSSASQHEDDKGDQVQAGEMDLPRKSGGPLMKEEDFHAQAAETFYRGLSR